MSFYSHFPSKKDLVIHYLAIREEEWFSLLDKHINSEDSAELKVLMIFDALHEWFKQEDYHGCPFLNGLTEFNIKEDEKIVNCISQHFIQTDKLITNLIKDFKQKKDLAEQLALLVIGAIGLSHATSDSKPALQAKDMAKKLLNEYS